MDEIREILHDLVRVVGLLNKDCCGMQGIGVSVVQSHIIYEINKRNKPSIQQVAELLGIDITTFSRQVQSLVEMDLVIKSPDPSDRRVSVLSLTENGGKKAQQINCIMNNYLHEVFAQMTEFEKETVFRSFMLFSKALHKTGRPSCDM